MPQRFQVIGFPNEKTLVNHVAKSLNVRAFFATEKRYHQGELSLFGPKKASSNVIIVTNIKEDAESLLRTLLLVRSLREHGARTIYLLAPWIAYGRQDRVTSDGESPAGLVYGNLLGAAFDRIYTFDAHSERFMKSFGGKLINVFTNPSLTKKLANTTLVVAPDKGAYARAKAAAVTLNVPFIALDKQRSGQNVKTTAHQSLEHVREANVLLVDDMADSGGTLVAASQVLKASGAKRIQAFIPHALNPEKLRLRTVDLIDWIEIVHDHTTNQIAPKQLDLLVKAVLNKL